MQLNNQVRILHRDVNPDLHMSDWRRAVMQDAQDVNQDRKQYSPPSTRKAH